MLAFSTAAGKQWSSGSSLQGIDIGKADGYITGYVPIRCGLKPSPCNQISPDLWDTEASNTSQQMTGVLLHFKDSPESSVLPCQHISSATFTQISGRMEGDGHSSTVLSHSFLKPWGRTLLPSSQPGVVLVIPYYHMQQMRNHQIWENEQEEVQLLLTHGKKHGKKGEYFVSLGHHISSGLCKKLQWAHIYSWKRQVLRQIYEGDLGFNTLYCKFLLIPLQYFYLFLAFKIYHEGAVHIHSMFFTCSLLGSFIFDWNLGIGILKHQVKIK